MRIRHAASRARACAMVAGLLGVWSAAAGVAGAQELGTGPIALADGRVTIGGDVSATYGSDDPGFFNYTDYEHSALRMLRVNLSALVKAGEHVSFVGDVQTENLDSVRPYALYARIRPWTARDIDVQIGRVPPTFGAFSRRTYVSDNPLIGYPLAYQYLSSLRPDALPATVDELLQKRSFGWLVRYSIGDQSLDHGVPLVNGLRWDTGVQVHVGVLPQRVLTATGSITTGTLSNPRFKDDNGGKQFAGRAEWRPTAGVVVGTSMARGAFVSDSAANAALPPMHSTDGFTQMAWGGDVEYSRDYYLIRAETIVTEWRLPFARQPEFVDPLRATATSIEGRYKLTPGFYAAARFDHLGFSTVAGTTVTQSWDAPVTRVEIGGGYSIQRNLLLKLAYQHNHRDGGRLLTTANQVATQVVFWW
jgi:hypothetical protein